MKNGFAGVCPVGEYFEDHFLAVDGGEFRFLLPVALLGGGEGFVEDDDIGFGEAGGADDFIGFAGAEEEGRVGGAEIDEDGADDGEAEVFDELGEFGQKFGGFAGAHVGGLDADEEGALEFVVFERFEKLCHSVRKGMRGARASECEEDLRGRISAAACGGADASGTMARMGRGGRGQVRRDAGRTERRNVFYSGRASRTA